MRLRRPLFATLLYSICAAAVAGADPDAPSERALALHQRLIALDSHLDTPAHFARPGWSILDRHSFDEDFSQIDLPRMREGGLDGGFWVIYTPQRGRDAAANLAARDAALQRLFDIRETVAAHPEHFALATTAGDAAAIAAGGKRIVYISIENASPLAADPSLLSAFHRLGVRMLGLVHTKNNDFADSSTDEPEWHGLSPKGRELVKAANRLGIVLDQSHASDAVFDQLIELSRAPIVLSHTGSDAVFEHPRNIDDARIRKLAEKGGVIQVNSLSGYLIPTPKIPERDEALKTLYASFGDPAALTPRKAEEIRARRREIDAKYPVPRATFEDYMKHLLHILQVAGPDHVGLGADWDGGGGVTGLEDVSDLPKITERLLREGYSEAQIEAIWSGNLLRVLREAERLKETDA